MGQFGLDERFGSLISCEISNFLTGGSPRVTSSTWSSASQELRLLTREHSPTAANVWSDPTAWTISACCMLYCLGRRVGPRRYKVDGESNIFHLSTECTRGGAYLVSLTPAHVYWPCLPFSEMRGLAKLQMLFFCSNWERLVTLRSKNLSG